MSETSPNRKAERWSKTLPRTPIESAAVLGAEGAHIQVVACEIDREGGVQLGACCLRSSFRPDSHVPALRSADDGSTRMRYRKLIGRSVTLPSAPNRTDQSHERRKEAEVHPSIQLDRDPGSAARKWITGVRPQDGRKQLEPVHDTRPGAVEVARAIHCHDPPAAATGQVTKA